MTKLRSWKLTNCIYLKFVESVIHWAWIKRMESQVCMATKEEAQFGHS